MKRRDNKKLSQIITKSVVEKSTLDFASVTPSAQIIEDI